MARNDKRIDQLKPSENALKSTDLFAMYSDNRTEQQPLSNVIDYLQSTINTSYFTGGTINGPVTFTDNIYVFGDVVSACTSTVYINTLSPCGGSGSTMTFNGSIDISGSILSGGTNLNSLLGSQTLSQTLTNGNIVSTGQTIDGVFGTRIEFDYGGDRAVGITTDSGGYSEGWFYLDEGTAEMWGPNGGLATYGVGSYSSITGHTTIQAFGDNSLEERFGVWLDASNTPFYPPYALPGLSVFNNKTSSVQTSALFPTLGVAVSYSAATFLSSANSTMDSGVVGSVIIGGKNISGTTNDTVYVPHLEIRGQANTPVYNSGSGTTFTLDFDNSNIQTVTLTGNTTMNNPLNVKDGAVYTVIIKQGATTGTINSWDTNFKFESGTTPTLTTNPYAVDIITFISDDVGNLYGLTAFDFQ